MTQKEERELIARIIKKDERALLKIFKTYNKPIFNFIKRQLSDHHLTEEITQDVFFDFIERLRDFRGDSSLKTFLFSIARHKVIDEIRKKKIKKILFSALPKHFTEQLVTIILDDEIEKEELKRKIKKVFDMLPNDYRLVLRLKYIEGERVKEIARRLSLSFKGTESLLFRARQVFIKIFNTL